MRKYENVYNFKVLEEIEKGNKVYAIDKDEACQPDAIRVANNLKAKTLLEMIKADNNDNRYEFYKIVEIEESEEK